MGIFDRFRRKTGREPAGGTGQKTGESGLAAESTRDEVVSAALLPVIDASVMKRNNLTLLTLDERWNRLFVRMDISPELERKQNEVNELIKRDSLMQQELEQLEPMKKKAMQKIIFLTKEAFERDNREAKDELIRQKSDIEKLNARVGALASEIELSAESLRKANLELLRDTMLFVYLTLRKQRDRSAEIKRELEEIELKRVALTAELSCLSDDWTETSVFFTELVGSDLVQELEEAFLGPTRRGGTAGSDAGGPPGGLGQASSAGVPVGGGIAGGGAAAERPDHKAASVAIAQAEKRALETVAATQASGSTERTVSGDAGAGGMRPADGSGSGT